MEAKGIEKLAELKKRMEGDEVGYYKVIAPQLLILPDDMEYGILRADVQLTGGYLSDVAIRRLQQQFCSTVQQDGNGKVIVTKAKILGIQIPLFLKRKDIVPELHKQDLELEGNVYKINNHLYGLLFPIDLVNFDHLSVQKWRLK